MVSLLHRGVALLAVLAVFTAGRCAGQCIVSDCFPGSSTQQQENNGECHHHNGPTKHHQSQDQSCKHHHPAATERMEKTVAKATVDSTPLLQSLATGPGEIIPDVSVVLADFEQPPPLKYHALLTTVLRI
jgi:ABC-type nickel/cobalt efflux system permease component RcnA